MAGRIDAVMAALRNRQVRRVAWVNLSQRRAEFAATNAAIAAAAGRWPEMFVFDWESASDDAAGNRWFSDNVHLTATGRVRVRAVPARPGARRSSGGVSPRTVVPGSPLRVPVLGRLGVPGAGVAGCGVECDGGESGGSGLVAGVAVCGRRSRRRRR